MDEWYYLSTYHPDRSETEWRDLLKWQALPYAGYFCCLSGFLHSANAAVGMTCRWVVPFCPHRLYSKRCHGDESSPLHWVVPFNRTGCIRNVAGGRLPPLHGCTIFRLRRTFVFIHLAQKRMSKFGKKHLTNRWCCGNICKLSDERPPNGPEGGETLKNSLKKVKKGLDKLLRMC